MGSTTKSSTGHQYGPVTPSHRSEGTLRDGRRVTVRFKTPADLRAWRRFVALVPDDSGHRPGTELDLADLSTDYHKYDEPYLVAEVDGEIVGALFVVPREVALGYHRDHVLEFHMDVLPGWRRLGVGTALVGALRTWAGEREGVRKLEAAVLGWNEPVIRMLVKLGFREEGRRSRAWMVRDPAGLEEYDDIVTFGLWLDD